MGMTLTVRCPNGVPSWTAVSAWLEGHGWPAQIRMIDGQLTFPDEKPPADWRELRTALPGGMVTIRRDESTVSVVAWGNADDALRRSYNVLALAFAEIVAGTIITVGAELSVAEFRSRAELPPWASP
ncbi:MAG: hypothetical protein ACJ8F7_16355 [Gemmataceae bacterium]